VASWWPVGGQLVASWWLDGGWMVAGWWLNKAFRGNWGDD